MKRSREPDPPMAVKRAHPGMPPGAGAGLGPAVPPQGQPQQRPATVSTGSAAAAAAAASQQKLTTSDALSYLREVKNRFADRKQVYDTFLDIMKEFKAQRIDTSGVIVRVKQLFKGHRELILGFNTFLPKGYEIELARISDDEEEEEEVSQQQQQQQQQQQLQQVQPVQQQQQQQAPQQQQQQVQQPGAPKQAVEFDQAINYVNKIKTRFASDERVYKAFLEILNMYRKGQKNIHQVYNEVAMLFANHDDLLHEFTYFLPDTSQQGQASAQMRQFIAQRNPQMAASMRPGMPGMGMPGGPRPPMMRGGPMGLMMGMPGQGMPGSPVDHSRYMHKRKAARRAEEGFRRMDDVEEGYGMGARGRGSALAKEVQFLEKVKSRLRSRELYGDFLKCLNMYSQDIINRNELVHLVADILGRTPDLMAQFHQFVSSCEAMDLSELPVPGQRPGQPMSNRDLLKAKLQKDKYMTKPLSEIVANETERITPSYVKMPPGYPKLTQTGRTVLGDEVLNDQYVNVITGSEDYSFKLMRKNQYEEALFRCEDDRYEFDIAVEQNLSTIRAFKPVAEKLAQMSPEDRAAFSWQDMPRVSAVHLGHIQRLYGESGLQIVDLLQKNPAVAVPVILTRMQAKDQEWRKVKEDMIPVWRKIYEQNYPRSLDHRSFYFKQAEKKCMMAKVMVAEIKELADKRKADEHHLRMLSMAHKHRIPATAAPTPDLTFSYADRTVFEDVYLAIQTAVEHQLHPGSREQALLLYLQVIEPFFGLPLREEELNRLQEQVEDDGEKEDVDMADIKSDSSEQDAAMANGEEVQGPGKTPPRTDGTPEPGAEEKPQGSGEQTGATDAEEQEDGGEGGRGRGGSAEASGDTEMREGKVYTGCKPIMPSTGPPTQTQTSFTIEHPMPAPGARLLFGNENMYVFFRYHRYLYDRLCSARKFSLEMATKKATQPLRGQMPLPGQELAEGSRTPEPPSEAAIKEDTDRIHTQFLSVLTGMLSTPGSDIGAFEDQVRNLLGTNSYELFTLDKLLNRLAKHLALMVSDDQTHKLWEMYRYEQSRGKPITLSMYHINCHTVLDDTCYRMEYDNTDNTLRFQQGDAERSDAYLAPEASLPPYIVNYVSSNNAPVPGLCNAVASPDGGRLKPQLFLKRNVPAFSKAQDAEDALVQALGQVVVDNGLETKIACTSWKVSYVLDTEDMMVRCKRRSPRAAAGGSAAAGEEGEQPATPRSAKLDVWLKEQLRLAKEAMEKKVDENMRAIGQELKNLASIVAAATPDAQ